MGNSNGCSFLFVLLLSGAIAVYFLMEDEANIRGNLLEEIAKPYPNLTVDYHKGKPYPCILGQIDGVPIHVYFEFENSPSNTNLYIDLGKKGDFNPNSWFLLTKRRFRLTDNHPGIIKKLPHAEAHKIFRLKELELDFATLVFDEKTAQEMVNLGNEMGGFRLEQGLLQCVQIPIPHIDNPQGVEAFRKVMRFAPHIYKRAKSFEKQVLALPANEEKRE